MDCELGRLLSSCGVPLSPHSSSPSIPLFPARLPAPLCQVLDRLLSSWDVTSPQSQGSVEACLAEVEDLLSYCNDVLATGGWAGG